jgi:DNA-binding CsgD family transcriptional regulator
MRGPKPPVLTLSEKEQNEMETLVRRHSTPQQLAQRGRMILAAAEGKNNSQIARELGVSVDTVRSWRKISCYICKPWSPPIPKSPVGIPSVTSSIPICPSPWCHESMY